MDPNSVKSTLSTLAFGNVMAAAARDYQKDLMAKEKAQSSSSVNPEVDLDELMDDPELEKLHADRIAALKKEAEKRQELKMQGHGEYREITEPEFLGEVRGSSKVICHFYHREFYRCKNGITTDRLIGFQDLGAKDDFPTRTLEVLLLKKGIIEEKKQGEDDDDDYLENKHRTVRSSMNTDSDSD